MRTTLAGFLGAHRRVAAAVGDGDRVDRGEMAFVIVIAGAFLALLHIFGGYAVGVVVPAGGELVLGDLLYLPWLSVALLLGMALHAYLFWRGRWQVVTRIANLLIDLFGLVVLYRIAVGVWGHKVALEAELPWPVPTMIVQVAWSTFVFVAAVIVWETGKVVGRTVRSS